MKKPPKKLSKLMRLALKDLAAVERSPKYTVTMSSWHLPQDDGRCAVCLAGAVMAKTGGVSPHVDAWPNQFGPEWYAAFRALDEVRNGYVAQALYYMSGKKPDHDGSAGYMNVTYYSKNRKAWRRDMWKIVRSLEARKL